MKLKQAQISTESETSASLNKQPLGIRMLNRAGGALEQLGLSLANKSEESLMADACKKTGLSDWGDESFRVPFRKLLESFRADANMTYTGWLVTHSNISRILCSRLYIQDELNRHPEILQQEIHRPLFIISMPRTGTTLLHHLLSADSSNRSPLFWEMIHTAPPASAERCKTDPRIAEAEKLVQKLYKIIPDMKYKHSIKADSPEECRYLIDKSFTSLAFTSNNHLPMYFEWLDKQDMIPAYQYHRIQLQILQSGYTTERWVLKTPYHLYAMKALLTVYPDACVVQTHRDPCKSLPSLISLMHDVRSLTSEHVDVAGLSREILKNIKKRLDRYLKDRNSYDPARFIDIHYKDLVQDPIGTVRNMYEHFGYKYEDRFEERMRKWLAENSQHKHGVHRYSLEQFGLDQNTVESYFTDYCERFGISPE